MVADIEVDKVFDEVTDMFGHEGWQGCRRGGWAINYKVADMVADIEVDKVVDKVTDMMVDRVADEVAFMVVDMDVDMGVDMEVDCIVFVYPEGP